MSDHRYAERDIVDLRGVVLDVNDDGWVYVGMPRDVPNTWVPARNLSLVLGVDDNPDAVGEFPDLLHLSTGELIGEVAALRRTINQLQAELAKVKGYQQDLANRCYLKDLELDVLRRGGRLLDPMTDAYDDDGADDTAHLERLEARAEAERDGDHERTVER